MKTFRVLSILLPLILFCHLAPPVSADEEICTVPPVPDMTLNDAVEAYKNGKVEEALQIYRYIAEESRDPRIAGISSFMAGHMMGQLMLDGAEGYLERAYFSYPLIGDYALFRLAGVHESRGENDEAADLYKTIYESYPDSVLQKKSLLKAADSYLASGKTEDARDAYETYLSIYPEDKSVTSALYGLGMSYLLDDKTSLAFDYFKRIWIDYPADPLSWSAKEKINWLRGKGYELLSLTPADTYIRAERLYEAGLYSDALTEYKRFLSHTNGTSDANEKDAYFKIGISNYHLRRSEEAEDAFESFLNRYPGHYRAREALYWLGRTYLRERKEDAFIKASKGYLKRYKDSGKSPEVVYRIGNFYAEKRNVRTATSYYDRVMKEYPHSSFAADSQWAKGWLLYKERDIKKALRVFDNIIQQKKDSPLIPRALYWKARVLEMMNDPEGMEKSLCQLCKQYEKSFYCLFARHSYAINCASAIDVAGTEVSGDMAEEIRDDSMGGITEEDQNVRIKLFFYLGLKEDAVEEIQGIRKKLNGDRGRSITMASMLSAMGEYNMALSIVYSNLSRYRLHSGHGISRGVWRLMYPTGYGELINKYADEYGVDPFLLYALIREESWFNENAVSIAGAVGLMQLMPQTASSVLQDPDIKRESLFDPQMNIYLGTRFFSDLLRQFDGNMILAVASYNAGPHVVSRWLEERDGFDLDEFIEDIPYRETREYVKKVFKSYMEYLSMGGDNGDGGG